MKRPQQRSSRSGLTLIEIVMATAVLSIVLLGMFGAMDSSQRADVLTRERAAAAEACHSMLDSVLTGPMPGSGNALELAFAVNYDTGNGNVPLKPATTYPSDPWTFKGSGSGAPMLAGVAVAGVAIVKGGVNVGDGTPNEDNTNLIEARVLVAWRSADGSDQRVEATSRRVR